MLWFPLLMLLYLYMEMVTGDDSTDTNGTFDQHPVSSMWLNTTIVMQDEEYEMLTIDFGESVPQALRRYCENNNISYAFDDLYDYVYLSIMNKYLVTFNDLDVHFPKYNKSINVVNSDHVPGNRETKYQDQGDINVGIEFEVVDARSQSAGHLFQLSSDELVFPGVYHHCEKYMLDAPSCDKVLHLFVNQLVEKWKNGNALEEALLKAIIPKHYPHVNYSSIFYALADMNKLTLQMKNVYKLGHLPSKVQSNGLMILPHKKLAMCVMPKGGCTTIKLIILALLGFSPPDICRYVQLLKYHMVAFHGIYEQLFTLLGGEHLDELYYAVSHKKNDIRLSSVKYTLMNVFGGVEYTSIAFVRDPWARAISSFHQDLRVHNSSLADALLECGNVTLLLNELRQSFFDYHSSNNEAYHHSIPQTKYCGLSHLKYDHYLDVKNKLVELRSVLNSSDNDVLSSGWDNCTAGARNSILGSTLKSPHVSKVRFTEWHEIYCTQQNVDLISKKFEEDYKVLGPVMNYTRPSCSQLRS